MILTNQQAAALLTLLDAGGTGTLTFKNLASSTVVSAKTDGIFIAEISNGRRDSQEVYVSAAHFGLAYEQKPRADFTRAAAHYPAEAAKAREMVRNAAERTGEEVLPEHRA